MRRSEMDPPRERTRGDLVQRRLLEDDVRREMFTIKMESQERRGTGGFKPPAGISPVPSILVGSDGSSKIGEPRNLVANEAARHAAIPAPPTFVGNEGPSMIGEPRGLVGNDVARMVGESHGLTGNEGVRLVGEPRFPVGASDGGRMMGEPRVFSGSNDGARTMSEPHILAGNEHPRMIGQGSIFSRCEGTRMAGETHAFAGNEGARMIGEPRNHPINEGARVIGGPPIFFPSIEGGTMPVIPHIFPGNEWASVIEMPHIGVPHIFPVDVGGIMPGGPHAFAGVEEVMMMADVQHPVLPTPIAVNLMQHPVLPTPNAVNVGKSRKRSGAHSRSDRRNVEVIDEVERKPRRPRPARSIADTSSVIMVVGAKGNSGLAAKIDSLPGQSNDGGSGALCKPSTGKQELDARLAGKEHMSNSAMPNSSNSLDDITTSSSLKNVEKPVQELSEKRSSGENTTEQKIEGPVKAKFQGEKPMQDAKKPTQDAKKPTQDAKKPTQDAKKPTQDAKKPTQDAKEPGHDAKEPGHDAKEPVQDVKTPAQHVKKPAQNVKKPAQNVKKPVQNVKKSVELPEKSSIVEHQTEHKIEGPAKTKLKCKKSTEELPEKRLNVKHATQRKPDLEKAKVQREKPVQNEDKPMQNADKPMQNADKPVQNADKPVQNVDKPVQNADKPVQNADKPVQELPEKKINVKHTMEKKVEGKAKAKVLCEICNVDCCKGAFEEHMKGRRHRQKLKALIKSQVVNDDDKKNGSTGMEDSKLHMDGQDISTIADKVASMVDGLDSAASVSIKLHTDENPEKKKLVADVTNVNASEARDEVAAVSPSKKANKPVQDLPKDQTVHPAKKRKREDTNRRSFRCELCEVYCSSMITLEDHLKGKKHRAREQAVAKKHKS